MATLKVEDYLRLAKATPTVEKEFEYFKESIFNKTLVWEDGTDSKTDGRLTNTPGDSGGWTIWGIAYNSNKEEFDTFDQFKKMGYEAAAAIAYTKYYRAISAFILPLDARLMYFDTAYNMGNVRAIKMMQACCGVPQDGLIGPATREKMVNVTAKCLHDQRNTAYNSLVRANIKLGKFLTGWLRRSDSIYTNGK